MAEKIDPEKVQIVVEHLMEIYKDARWAKREFDLEVWLGKYPQHTQRIEEAIEDYELSLAARGLDKVIEASKSAAEVWDELLPKLKEAFEKETS